MALSFKRKVGDVVMVGEDCSVRVKEISGSHVVLEFNAPISTKIHRLEVWKRILHDRAMKAAADAGAGSAA